MGLPSALALSPRAWPSPSHSAHALAIGPSLALGLSSRP
jgi:hypothetical protein